jgi:hypothetical protein
LPVRQPDSCNNVSLTSGRNYTVNGANGPIYINGTLNLNNNQITNSSATNPMIIYVRGQLSVVKETLGLAVGQLFLLPTAGSQTLFLAGNEMA